MHRFADGPIGLGDNPEVASFCCSLNHISALSVEG
jgi:hypothetical protein